MICDQNGGDFKIGDNIDGDSIKFVTKFAVTVKEQLTIGEFVPGGLCRTFSTKIYQQRAAIFCTTPAAARRRRLLARGTTRKFKR